MAISQIPLRADLESYRMTLSLDGSTYIMDVHYNERDGAWYFDLYAEDETPLLLGRKIVVGMPLTSRYPLLTLPPGELIAVDTSASNTDPGDGELGTRVVMYYADAADVASA